MPESHPGAHVAAGAELGRGVTIEPGAVIYAGARIGDESFIGSCAVVRDGVRIGAHCVVEDGVVLGKRPRLRAGSSAAGAAPGELIIGDEVTACAGAVVYAGASIGRGAIIGEHTPLASIRTRTSPAPGSASAR